MASSKLAAIFPLLLCFSLLLMQAASECDSGHGCSKAMAASQQFLINRKVGYVMHGKGKAVSGLSTKTKDYNGHGETVEDWELRKVPAGPDPLHHNGGSPKKPRTSP